MPRVSNSDIENIKINLDFVGLAENNGYIINHKASSKLTTVLHNENTGSKISISRNSNNHFVFYDFKPPSFGKTKGTVIDFAQTYLNLDYPKALHFLKNYNEKTRGIVTYDQTFQAKAEKTKTVSDDYFSFKPLRYTKYLNERGISNETLFSPMFKNNIGEKDFISSSGNPYNTVVFPMYHKISGNKVVGLEKKSAFFSGTFENSDKKSSFWKSTPISSKPDLIIVESGIDALAHFELNKNTNAFYIGSNGYLSPERIGILKDYISRREKQFNSFTLGMDNDVAGIKFNINVAGNFNIENANKDISFFLHSNRHHASLEIKSLNKQDLLDFGESLNKLNNSLNPTSDFNDQFRFKLDNIQEVIENNQKKFKLDVNLNNRLYPLKALGKAVFEAKNTPFKSISPLDKDFAKDLENKMNIKRFSVYKVEGSKEQISIVAQKLKSFNTQFPKSFVDFNFYNKNNVNTFQYSMLKIDSASSFNKSAFKSFSEIFQNNVGVNFSHRKVKDVWKNPSLDKMFNKQKDKSDMDLEL